MANFDDGVSGYIWGRAVVSVPFPIDHRGHKDVSCKMCRYLDKYNRKCKLNDEVTMYPDTNIGYLCPLDFEKEEE